MAFLKNVLPLDMGSHENVSVGFISISGAGMLLHKELTTVEDSPHITVQHVSFRCSGGDSVLWHLPNQGGKNHSNRGCGLVWYTATQQKQLLWR